MIRILISAGLLVASAPALCASWEPITTPDGARMHLYVDPDSIDHEHTSQGLLVMASAMTDFGHPVDGFSSEKTSWTFDCAKRTARWTQVVKYSGSNATGIETPGKENSDLAFKPVVPGSVGYTVWKRLCK
jgi:hypothetical protein